MKVPISIPPGIDLDDTTFSTGQTAWADVGNVRFWRGQPQTIGGWQRLVVNPVSGICRKIFPWTDNSGNINIGFGTHTHLQVWLGGTLFDVTPTSFVAGNVDGLAGLGWGTGAYGAGLYGEATNEVDYPLTWSLDTYGQNLIACPRGQTIFQWTNNTATPAAPITNAPAAVTCALVTTTRQIMALGCNDNETSNFNARAIRFSDIENPTVWTPTVSNAAGEFIIDCDGVIKTAKLMGEAVAVWTDDDLFLGQYDPSLNAAGQVNGWDFKQVGEKCGLIGVNAVTILAEQLAYWMGSNGQFYEYSLGGAPQIVPSPVQDDVFSNLVPAQNDKVMCSSCAQFGEIRWDYPDIRDQPTPIYLYDSNGAILTDASGAPLTEPIPTNNFENSRYVVYSTGGNLSPIGSYQRLNTIWSRGFMVRTAYVDASTNLQYPIGVDNSGLAFYHELGQSADGAAFDWYAQTADFYASDNVEQLLKIRSIWPDVHGQLGTINLTIKTRLYPQDANVRSKGPFLLTPGRSKKDFLATGRIIALRYEGNSAPTFARLGMPVYDAIDAGLR